MKRPVFKIGFGRGPTDSAPSIPDPQSTGSYNLGSSNQLSGMKICFSKDTSHAGYLPLPQNPGDPVPVIPITGYGDMFRAVYDVNINGIVDDVDMVNWVKIEQVPVSFPSTIPEVAGLEQALADIGGSNPRQAYTHQQSIASDEWIINHNLGYRPDVATFRSDDQEFEAFVIHVNNNTTHVRMNIATSGYARLT